MEIGRHTFSLRAASAALFLSSSIIWLTSIILTGSQIIDARNDRIEDGIMIAETRANLLQEHTRIVLDIAARSVSALALTIQDEKLLATGREDRMFQLLQRRAAASPATLNFTLTDALGIVRHSSTTRTATPLNISHMPHIIALQNEQINDVQFAVYHGIQGRALNRLVLAVSTKLQGSDGQYQGAAHASISLPDLRRMYAKLDLNDNGSSGLIHDNGIMVIHMPDPTQSAGKNFSEARSVRAILDDPNGAGVIHRLDDGDTLYQAYRRIDKTPLTVVVSLSQRDILAPWRTSMIAAVVGESVLSLLILVLTLTVYATLKRRDAVEQQNLILLEQAREAATQAEQARDEIAQVFATTSDGVIILDETLRYIFVNDAFLHMTGAKSDEFLGTKLVDRVGAESTTWRNLSSCFANKRPVTYQNTFKTKAGETRWVDVRAYPVGNKVTAYVRDVTARRESEQKLLEAQRMDAVGRLAGGMAHDFNNMLAVIIGNIEMLIVRLSDSRLIQAAQSINTAAVRSAEMVSRLLAFARKQPLNPSNLDVRRTIYEVQNLIQRSLPTNIILGVTTEPQLWHANVDAGQCENALVNLVINARDAMVNGGRITIAAENIELNNKTAAAIGTTPGAYVMISVEDTGTGIEPDVLHKVFEPFFTTKAPGKGTGLGLSMVYGFAKQSGGHARIQSEPGRGTTVQLYLPRALPHPLASSIAPVPLAEVPGGSETILLVEDEEMVRRYVQALLNKLGYRVIAHSDAEGALREIQTGLRPDLLLSDIVLTGTIDGQQLARRALALCEGLRVLLMTGYAENAVTGGGQHGDLPVLIKPFRQLDMALKLRSVFEAPAPNAAELSAVTS